MNTESHNESPANPAHPLSDPELSSLLRSLPHEQASLGFEERVKRRLREGAPTPISWWSRSVRVAAPLMAAAMLGFIFGPDVFRHGADPDPGPGATAVQAADGMQPMNPPRSLAIEPSRAIPSIARGPQAQPVSNGASSGALSSPRVRQIQQEAARIRQQLDELRRQQIEAMPRVLWTTEDGVEVEVDLAEFLLMLEGSATAMEAGATGNGAGQPTLRHGNTPVPPSAGSGPPRW